MEKDFLQEIESRRGMITTIDSQMKQVRSDFVVGIRPFAQNWLQTIARQAIERNPRQALDLGKDRLAALKTKVNELCDGLEPICREVFASDTFWPETRELVTQNQLGVRIVLGKLGIILEEFGFVKTQAQTDKDQEAWHHYDCSGDRREFDGTPVYPHTVDLPAELKILLEEYLILIRKKDNLREDINRLEFEKLQVQATRLWDSL